MARRFFTVALALALMTAACGGGGKAETCEELADNAIELMQGMIESIEEDLGDLSLEQIVASGGEELPELDRFRERAADVDAQAEALGCSDEEMQTLIQDRAGSLEATTPIGEFIIDGIRSGSF